MNSDIIIGNGITNPISICPKSVRSANTPVGANPSILCVKSIHGIFRISMGWLIITPESAGTPI